MRNSSRELVQDSGEPILIQIVLHICYDNYDEKEIEKDAAHTVELLNKDFANTCDNFNYASNFYSGDLKNVYDSYLERADTAKVQFELHSIVYAPSSPQFLNNISVIDRAVKGNSPAVEPRRALNIWVADLRSGLLGYAQFPWELEESPETDGVVIGKDTFGRNPSSTSFNLGKTLTHEVGHWLGLYHTFQETFDYEGGDVEYTPETDQDNEQQKRGDCVVDTPWQGEATGGNPFENPSEWPRSKPSDEEHAEYHMFMNFMDYSDDQALFMFTADQCKKLRLLTHIYRPLLLEDNSDLNYDAEFEDAESDVEEEEENNSQDENSENEPENEEGDYEEDLVETNGLLEWLLQIWSSMARNQQFLNE